MLGYQPEQVHLVDNGAQEIFTGQVKSARMVPMPGTKHEIYMSDDSHMRVYVEEILDFLEK